MIVIDILLVLFVLFPSLMIKTIMIAKCIVDFFNAHLDFKTIFSILISFVLAQLGKIWYDYYVKWQNTKDKTPYITFSADDIQVFSMSYKVATLEYSVGNNDWTELGTKSIIFGGNYGKLRLRGKSRIGTIFSTISFATKTEVVCSGDIRTLIDYKNFNNVDTSKAVFNNLFFGCKQLVTAPELKLNKLADSCYIGMFSGCTSLSNAPELPAVELAKGCYCEMFSNCTSLRTVPYLPAKKLADYCYANMFRGCTSLVEIPQAKKRELQNEIYANIENTQNFHIELVEITRYLIHELMGNRTSVLPAIELAKGCYLGMFSNCTSLRTAPYLPAKKLANNCYAYMFSGCKSLKDVQKLPADELAEGCYSSMFKDCIEIENAPELPAHKLVSMCYANMFSGCKSLKRIKMHALEGDFTAFMRWLENVSQDGTLFKNKDSKLSMSNAKYIVPEKWKVEEIHQESENENLLEELKLV